MWRVGSGFFLDHAQFASAAPRIVLMDMSRGRAGLRGTAPLALQPRDTDSLLERDGFELVWGFSCQVVFWFVAGSLFGARKSFFVPSPAIRFRERAEGVKGPKR